MRPSLAALPLVAALILLTPNEAYGHYLNSPTNRNEARNAGRPMQALVHQASVRESFLPGVHLPVVRQDSADATASGAPTSAAPRSFSQLSSVSRDWTRPNLNLPPVPPAPVAGKHLGTPGNGSGAQPTQDVGRVASRGGVVVSGEGSATPLSPLQLKIRWCESRDNYRAQNSASTASGGWQFLDTTWHSNSGLPGHAKDYPQAVQDRVFLLVFSEQGTRPWLSSMSCWG